MIDVQIVAYGDAEMVNRCLDALPDGDSALVSAVVVVDHLGNLPSTLPKATTVIRGLTNPGFGAGHNRALGAGTSPFVLVLNPDARLEQGALESAAAWLTANPRAGAVQGVIRDADSGRPERSQGRELGVRDLWGRALGLSRWIDSPVGQALARAGGVADHVDRVPATARDVASLAATAVLFRRAALESVGGFDERFFLYGEDVDLCRRLRNQGWRLIAVPDPWARHVGGASSRDWRERERWWWQGTLLFAARWWSSPRYWAALGASVVAAVRTGWPRPSEMRVDWSTMTRAAAAARRLR